MISLAQAVHPDSTGLNLAVTMLIVFGSAKILDELFERLRMPGIVGEILAGVLIGPSVLGWVSPGEFTDTLAKLGVMFLLFRVGLEVEPSELLDVGGTALTVGVCGVVAPFMASYLLYRLAGHAHMESIFVGAAMTATSVGITAQVLASKGLLRHLSAKIILGAAVIDDILALLLLGAVSSFAEGEANLVQLGLTSLAALLFVLIVGKWGRKTMSRFLPRLESNLQMSESYFALAMVLLFGLAALSQEIGVAAIIGAFLAGMALSEALPPRVHDLARGVSELLVPFFLASIGLQFSLDEFATRSTLLIAIALVPVAVLGKVVGCGLGAFRYGRAVAVRVGVGMIPRGEFCMVVAQVGLSIKAMSAAAYAEIVFVAVTAALVTPPLLKLAFRGASAEPGAPGPDLRAS